MTQTKTLIEVPDFITVRELANIMEVSPIDVIKELMGSGIMANINQQIDFDTASIVAEEMGFEVYISNNGDEALKFLTTSANDLIDLIFMDCQMPIMDGYETTRQIRSGKVEQILVNIPIIAMTANAMKGDRERCLDAGMNNYLTKPIDSTLLESVLRRFL